MKQLDWPLMRNNITGKDIAALKVFLGSNATVSDPFSQNPPQLTNGPQVRAFEEEFAQWLGCKYAVMVNSGASANLITMAAVRDRMGPVEVLIPCVTWISDVAAVLHAGLTPVFADISLDTLGVDWKAAKPVPVAFPTHCLGFDAGEPPERRSIVIEDCCESLGATRGGKKLGTFGEASNFSFYYAHHMSTIEGGMVCTDDQALYQTLRRLRSHGLVREMDPSPAKDAYAMMHDSLDPNFIFAEPAFNVRSTELNAVIGRSQLKRLDGNNDKRRENLVRFLNGLHAGKYRVEYRVDGSCNYALPLILREPDDALSGRVLKLLDECGVEYRCGTAGGGNQLRQPYAKQRWGRDFHKQFPNAEHVHCYGLYIGNYPGLEAWKIEALCEGLNAL